MLDMGEFFDSHEFADFHRSEPADPPDIVPCEIHEHGMFGTFLCVTQEILCKLLILFRGFPPGSCSRNGTVVTFLFSTRTSISGLAPITFSSPKSR